MDQPRVERATAEPILEGKCVIASVQGVKALSTGFIDCVPAELLIDSGAVACLVHSRVLKRIEWSTEPLRGYAQRLNVVSGHSLKTRGVINLPLRLGSLEKTIPFIVVDQLHVDAILGTDALREFKAVMELEDNVVTHKGTGKAFPIGSLRVEESYHARISPLSDLPGRAGPGDRQYSRDGRGWGHCPSRRPGGPERGCPSD
ncbi:hypothetical protein L914_17442 [Phytophthora nicotianae]|uniref:Peptidase A2 domain-containing protein n=1 Tax=Phytophthora nicotianae TaxID=4792 RepID=W2MJM9_PHYNI|nr:hypothetical protein L914_17442 [Phytophthora nicotianae]